MSYRVRTLKRGWCVVQDIYLPSGKRKVSIVRGTELASLGIAHMNKEQASAWLKQRWPKARHVVAHQVAVNEAHLPATLLTPFTEKISRRGRRAMFQWAAAQRIILNIQIPTTEWYEERGVIYKAMHGMSLDYARRVLNRMNDWGRWVMRHTGIYYESIPMPTSFYKEGIVDAAKHHASLPLTPAMLLQAKDKLSVEQYRWLYVSVWCGLRPSEIDRLANPLTYKITEQQGIPVLSVFQEKLVGVPRNKRWKHIPALCDEQLLALQYVKEKLQRPLVKTITKHIGVGVSTYGGRKGFVALARDRLGASIYEISSWLGHVSIDRTKKDYEQPGVILEPRRKKA